MILCFRRLDFVFFYIVNEFLIASNYKVSLNRILLIILSFVFLTSPANSLTQWQKIKEKGYLSWITRPSPLTYYNSLDGIIGLEHDILKGFCEENNINLITLSANSNYELFKRYDSENIDIVGGHLSLTKERLTKYKASDAYDKTSVHIISSLRKPKIRGLEYLPEYRGVVLENSSYGAVATSLIKNQQANIELYNGESIYELLQDVMYGKIDYTLADIGIYNIFRSYVPKLRLGQKVSNEQSLVFYNKNLNDDSLIVELNKYLKKYIFQNKVNRYKKFLQQTLPKSKPADTVQFMKNYNKRWQEVKPLIDTVAEKYGINPILLAAISYQESHWNADAVSPTLVKGLMMLTKAVAEEQGVKNRFDPFQSLEGGVKHFLKMKQTIPERISEPDKTYFALAAYNIGYGNLEKARVITQMNGKNPDIWEDVKEHLPELNDMDGFNVDGKTAVRYVENIRVYQKLLQWKQQI